MRIIAGSARSRVIKTPAGNDTRPTLDRVRESLFNILQRRVFDARVLDLFAGSGALSLEAISRGAASSVMVDHDREANRCQRENVAALHFEQQARILLSDWRQAVAKLKTEGAQFDLIMLDPPYAMRDLTDVMNELRPLMAEDALIVIEHESRSFPVTAPGFELTDSRKYGYVGVSFFRLTE